jgi:hypothetical protein
MKELTVKVDTTKIADILDERATGRLRASISMGVRNSLAEIQRVHKTEVVGRGVGPWGGAWSTRTGEATRSFHIDWQRGDLEGAYGSELKRVGVLEMGTQEALGGPLRPKKGKYLAIPTAAAKVGRGRAVWPSQRDDLYFAKTKDGRAFLFSSKTKRLMYVLRTEVSIPAHPTLDRTVARSQGKTDAIMLNAASNWMRG